MEVRQYHLWFIKRVIMKKIAARFSLILLFITSRPTVSNIYPYYAHGLTGSSDKGRECFAKFIQFTKEHIYD